LKQVGYQELADPAGPHNAVKGFHGDPWVRAARQGRVLTDRRRVDLLLKGVNSGKLSAGEWVSLQSGAEAIVAGAESRPLRPELRQIYRDILSHFVKSKPRVNSNMGQALCARLEDSITGALRAEMTPQGNLVFNYQAFGGDEEAGLDYALVLLLGSNGPFARDLCMCRLCGKFFLVKPIPVGRPRREFCTDRHRDTFFEQGASARVKKARLEHREAKQLGMSVSDYRAMKRAGISPEEWKQRRKHK
jgi:hypothetical protein